MARVPHDFEAYLELPDRTLPFRPRPEHLFAVFFQIARAFHSIFENIVGGSSPTARLRAAVWQSIFTHDMRRYMRTLYRHMADIATLITGPSGSGKELVARAVGQSLYTEFDPKGQRFAENRYSSLNLSAFAPTLIESELFGSVRGAFSGATDRVGWLEECGSLRRGQRRLPRRDRRARRGDPGQALARAPGPEILESG